MRKLVDITKKSIVRWAFSTQKNSQYDALNHSLLKQIFIYKYNQHYCGYLIIDSNSKKMICIDPGDYAIARYNIEMLEMKHKVQLSHILCTHFHNNHSQSASQIKQRKPDVQIVVGDYGQVKAFHTKLTKELIPFTVGDLAICFLHTPGHTDDSCTIAVTHVNPTSTKLPVLFTGDTLLVGSIGRVHSNDFSAVHKSLFKIKSFSNETMIFPGHDGVLENLFFAKTLDPNNQVINMKIEMAKEAQQNGSQLIPTSLFEEKNSNPFLRVSEPHFIKLLEEKDPVKSLKKLKLTQEMYFSTK